MLAIVIGEGAAIVLLALLVAGLLRSHAEILRRLHQLGAGILPDATAGDRRGVSAPARPQGAPAPDITGVTLSDETAAIAVRSPERDGAGVPVQRLRDLREVLECLRRAGAGRARRGSARARGQGS